MTDNRRALRIRSRAPCVIVVPKLHAPRLARELADVPAVHAKEGGTRPDYFIELDLRDGEVTAIRDFRYVPYIAKEAAFAPVERGPAAQCMS